MEWECCLAVLDDGLEKLPEAGREVGRSFEDAIVGEYLRKLSDDPRAQNFL